ncbi:hypothetical protein A0H81_07331 [Grifola frondosa]|uniref:Uncharacterized protein n=1 Tax=Grifola frondosa TaxID=5627 RepID=A0A1C7MCT7_GRIFR|nr:hypothetical protein A0H81_07331 [Grifola frondosa]
MERLSSSFSPVISFSSGSSLTFHHSSHFRDGYVTRLLHETISHVVSQRCAFLGRFSQVVEILPFLISGLFASLRAYAIGGRKWPIALPIFVLSIVPIGIQIYTFTRLVPYNFPSPVNCAFNENSPVAISNALHIIVTLTQAVPYVEALRTP